jgi:DNA-binding PadR family transcriptional regulator
MTGYELSKTFRDSLSFFWQAKTSQIYHELDTMERYGWLTSERVIQDEKPNKRVYTIIEDGEAELKDWLDSPESDIAEAMRVKSAFMMRVFFAGESNAERALEILRAYRTECAGKLEEMKATHDIIAGYAEKVNHDAGKIRGWKIAALYCEEYYRAGLIWADKAVAILEEAAKGEEHDAISDP